MRLSIVSTLFKSAPFVDEFLVRAIEAAEKVTSDFEIILVDDGSPDDSLDLAALWIKREPRIRLLELSRNFGHHAAILAGLERAAGDMVFLVDSDLEEPPELLLTFYEKLQNEGLDVVYGVHRQDTGGIARRVTSGVFWQIFNFLSSTKSSRNICHVRLMRREYLDALLSLQERNIFLGGMYAWAGFRQQPVLVERKLRRQKSTYSPIRRLQLFATSIVAFSGRPLVVIFLVGVAVSIGAIIYGAALLIRKIIDPDSIVSGFASLMIANALFSGIIIATLGFVGIYVGQAYSEVKNRPRYIVRRELRADEGVEHNPNFEAKLGQESVDSK